MILVLYAVVFIIIRYIFNFEGLYGQDSFEYYRYAKEIKSCIFSLEKPKPFFWPVLYPLLGAFIDIIFNNMTFSLQLISCLSMFFTIVYFIKTIDLLYPSIKKSLLAFIIIASIPFFIKFSILIMSDALTCLFVSVSIFHFIKYTTTKKTSFIFMAYMLSLFAIQTRYVSIVIFLPFYANSLYEILKKEEKMKSMLFILFAIVIGLLPHILLKWDDFNHTYNHSHIINWSLQNLFLRDFFTIDGLMNYRLPNILYYIIINFGPGYLLLISIISMIGLKKIELRKPQFLILFSIILYIIFLAGVPFQNSRFEILVMTLLLLLLFPALNYAFEKNNKVAIWISVIGSFLSIGIFFHYFNPILKRSILEKNVSAYFISNYPQKTIYAFDIDVAMLGYGVRSPIINIWKDKITTYQLGSLIIFNEAALGKQWENKNPMINWNYLKNNYSLTKLQTFEQGWEVYEIN